MRRPKRSSIPTASSGATSAGASSSGSRADARAASGYVGTTEEAALRIIPTLLIGLAVALAVGWISHGPLGRGEAFIAGVETRARAVVAEAGVPGVRVRLARGPLRRHAILSGPADQFQREGQGLFPGLNDRMLSISGIAGLHWEGEGKAGGLPLLVETWLLVLVAWAAGAGIGWRLFRPRRQGYL